MLEIVAEPATNCEIDNFRCQFPVSGARAESMREARGSLPPVLGCWRSKLLQPARGSSPDQPTVPGQLEYRMAWGSAFISVPLLSVQRSNGPQPPRTVRWPS